MLGKKTGEAGVTAVGEHHVLSSIVAPFLGLTLTWGELIPKECVRDKLPLPQHLCLETAHSIYCD